MDKLPGFVDMSITPEERKEYADSPVASQPMYPYGLCLYLCDDQLDKLGLEDPEVGDTLLMSCIVEVTSFSENKTTDGVKKRAELQITAIKEPEEEAEEPKPKRKPYENMYKKG